MQKNREKNHYHPFDFPTIPKMLSQRKSRSTRSLLASAAVATAVPVALAGRCRMENPHEGR